MLKKIGIVLTSVLLIFPAAVFAQGQQKAAPPRVLVDTVTAKNPTIYRKYNGIFEPIEKVTSLARISGMLEKINFQEGDMVDEGQVLFQIEDIRYKAAVKAAQSRIDVIKAKIRYAQNSYERNKELAVQKAVSEDTAENTLSVLEGFQAELLGAEADLTLAEEDLKYTQIHSMLKGRVGRVNYTEGNYITPQSGALVTVVQIDPIYIRFSMSERDFTSMYGNLEKLKERATLSIQLASGEYYQGKGEIVFIDNQITAKTDTLYIWARYDNPDQTLNPGGVATVLLARREPEARPAVKLSAVMFDREGHFVYTLNKAKFEDKDRTGKVIGEHEGTAIVRRNVTLGAADGEYQTIETGLEVGETIVVDGTHKAVPGDEITPVPVVKESQVISDSEDRPVEKKPAEPQAVPNPEKPAETVPLENAPSANPAETPADASADAPAEEKTAVPPAEEKPADTPATGQLVPKK